MARQFLTAIDLGKSELQNAVVQNLASAPSSPVKGQLYFDTVANKLYWYNGSAWVDATGGGGTPADSVTATSAFSQASAAGSASTYSRGDHVHGSPAHGASAHSAIALSDLATPAADLSLNSHKLTNVTDPTGAQDAATKAYVDSVAAGLAPKDAVRAATTATGTLATAYENGDVIDGVTLATGDRILLKNQSTASENGIYTVNASGAPIRTTDADSEGDLLGAAVFVSEGTVNGNTLWVMTADAPITVGSTSLTWAQFGGPGAYTAGTGLTLTGTSFALTTPVTVANGGTGAGDAATARTNLGATTKYAVDVGDGAATSITVTHNLAARDVIVMVRDNNSPYAEVIVDVEMTTTNTLTLRFATAPASARYRAIVIG